jgi:hypothetical protein
MLDLFRKKIKKIVDVRLSRGTGIPCTTLPPSNYRLKKLVSIGTPFISQKNLITFLF